MRSRHVDYYEVLNISREATDEEIKKAEASIQRALDQLQHCTDTYWGGQTDH